jgi:hypothetical protein
LWPQSSSLTQSLLKPCLYLQCAISSCLHNLFPRHIIFCEWNLVLFYVFLFFCAFSSQQNKRGQTPHSCELAHLTPISESRVPSAECRLDTALQCLGSVHGIRLKRHGHLALSSTDTGPHFPIHGNGIPSSTHLSESSFTSAANLCSSDRMEAWSGGCKAHSMSARCPCADFCSAVPLGHIKETQPLVGPCLNFREAIGCPVSRKIPVDTSLADQR